MRFNPLWSKRTQAASSKAVANEEKQLKGNKIHLIFVKLLFILFLSPKNNTQSIDQ